MSLFLTQVLVSFALAVSHPHDLCDDALPIEIYPDCSFTWIDTDDATNDFELNGMSAVAGSGQNVEIQKNGKGIWFEFSKTFTGTPLIISIFGGECIADPFFVINYGEFHGWTLGLWEGEDCASAVPVWSSNSNNLTDQWPGLIIDYDGYGVDEMGTQELLNDAQFNPTGYFDPTRQVWYVEIYDAYPGRYFLHVSGMGNCSGQAWVRVCEGYQALGIDQLSPIVSDTVGPVRTAGPRWYHKVDFAGRKIKD